MHRLHTNAFSESFTISWTFMKKLSRKVGNIETAQVETAKKSKKTRNLLKFVKMLTNDQNSSPESGGAKCRDKII
jgi:hypothetical protein